MSIDQRIREGLRATNDVLPRPDVELALAAVTAGSRGTRRRLIVALTAAAAVAAVVGGVFAVTRDGYDPQQPLGPTPTDTTTPSQPRINGRIEGIKDYLGTVRPGCDNCFDEGRGGVFDQDTGTVLFSSYQPADPESPSTVLSGVSVVSPDGVLADLTCGEGFPCHGNGQVVSGPGEDELTFWTPDFGTSNQPPSADQQLQVIGFDGSARFTLDLKPGIPAGEHARFVVWSPDGSRLAVTTREYTGASRIDRVRLVYRDGGEPQLVYTTSHTGPDSDESTEFLSPAAWHPDGSELGFIEEYPSHADRSGPSQGQPRSTRVVSLLLPEPGNQEPGTATTLHEFDDWCACSRRTFLWAPDGTRVAIVEPTSNLNERERVLELSADDGRILAQRPLEGFPLVWPARQP